MSPQGPNNPPRGPQGGPQGGPRRGAGSGGPGGTRRTTPSIRPPAGSGYPTGGAGASGSGASGSGGAGTRIPGSSGGRSGGAGGGASQGLTRTVYSNPASVYTGIQTKRFKAPGSEARTFVIVAAVLSVLVHVCVVLGIADTPLGLIDPSRLKREEVQRVLRAEDIVVEDKPADAGATDPAAQLDPKNADIDLAELSQALLLFDPDNPTIPRRKTDITPSTIKPVDDAPPPSAPGAKPDLLESKAPVLPRDLTADTGGKGIPTELPFVETENMVAGFGQGTKGNGAGGDGGSGNGDGASGGDASGDAIGLLDDADLALAPSGAGSGAGDALSPVPASTGDDGFDPTVGSLVRGDDRNPGSGKGVDFARIKVGGDLGSKLKAPESLDDDFDYALYTYKFRDEPGYFRVDIRPKRSLRKLRTLPKDVVFLIDTSGSITKDWMAEVTAGVTESLAALNKGDRFNIVLFKDNPVLFSPDRIAPATPQSIAAAGKFLKEAKSGGLTDVNTALSRLLVRDLSVERVYNLVMISDGVPTKGVKDTRQLINLITRDNDLVASIYCIGVGKKIDRELLNYLAYRNRGYCLFCNKTSEVRPRVRELLSRLRYPIIKDIRLDAVGVDRRQIFPADLPNVHQGDSLSVFGRFDKPGPFTMRLTGHNGEKRLDFTFKLTIPQTHPDLTPIATNWAFWKLHHLYSEQIRLGDTAQIRAEIDYLRRKYGLR